MKWFLLDIFGPMSKIETKCFGLWIVSVVLRDFGKAKVGEGGARWRWGEGGHG